MAVTRAGRDRRAGGAVLGDLAPSALLVAVTAAVDGVAAHAHAVLAPGPPLSDVALVLTVLSALAVLGTPGAVRRSRVRRAGIREVDAMTGAAFEERLAVLYRAMGYGVRHTGSRGDYGADLVVERDGERLVVQAKRYRGAVGIEAVQQVVGAARYYEATGAAVVTNSTCTPAARALASASEVELVERDALVRLLAAHTRARSAGAAAATLLRQLGEGARLCAYAGGAVLRLAWWALRAFGRPRGARRRRGA